MSAIRHLPVLFPIMISLCYSLHTAEASDELSDPEPFVISNWLVTGAVMIPHGYIDPDTVDNRVEMLLESPPVAPYDFWPEKGIQISLAPGKTVVFDSSGYGTANFSPLPPTGSEDLYLAYAAAYLDVPEWGRLDFEVLGDAPFSLFLDGELAVSRTTTAGSDTDKVSEERTVDQGFHRLLLVSAVTGKDSLEAWTFSVNVVLDDEFGENRQLRASTDPGHYYGFQDYYLADAVGELAISRDGRWLAADIAPWDRANDQREHHLEVWDMKTRKLVWEYVNPNGFSNLRWSPDGSRLMFATSAATVGSDLYLWDRQSLRFERIMHDLEHAGGFTWSPDGRVIYYTQTVPYETPEEKPYKAMWGLEDRWGGWRDDIEVHYMTIEGHSHGKLTSGKYNPSSFILSPDGSTILLCREVTLVERPYLGTEFWLISTSTGAAEKVFLYRSSDSSVSDLCFSPDGKKVVFIAPVNPVEGNESPYPDNNNNENDLWILDLDTGKVRNHTRDFEPSVAGGAYGSGSYGTLFWHGDGLIGFTGLYQKKVRFYFYDPDKPGSFREHVLPTPAATRGVASTMPGSRMFVFQGNRIEMPGEVFWYDWRRKKGGLLIEMQKEFKRLIKDPYKIIDYDYVNSEGVTIPGYLYYPADYDSSRKYPLIVDFYAGVYGYADGFLWMCNVFSTRGYFVYVPTPRGAAGWGQEFADAHPNDWGTLTTRDMNEGVRHIVEHIPAVDGSKCATVSGSYGGFMTMYMLSQPKDHPDFYPYATGISDYGISNLASYWGVGNWGYLYSDMATARNYPWNNPQYYVDHSPLYRADNITVPLLLLHGDVDTNVPPMESDQMYTALKVLNREVEFIRFPGEDHGIASKRGKYLLTKRMHMEWFDKHLRDLPGAWDDRMKDERKR